MELIVDLSTREVSVARRGRPEAVLRSGLCRTEPAGAGRTQRVSWPRTLAGPRWPERSDPAGDALIPPDAIRRLAGEAAAREARRSGRMGLGVLVHARTPQRSRVGSPRTAPSGPTSSGGLSVRFSYAESMVDPTFYLPLARAAEEAGLRRHGGARQHLLSARVRLQLPVLARPLPRVPRRQTVHRAVLADPGHGRGHQPDPLHHLRAQAAHAASAAGRQAGHLGGGDDRQPPRARRGHQPVARGLRVLCDVPWEGRGRRMDEAIDIVRGLSAGGYFEYHGEVFDLPPVKISPTPTAPLPILVGGHATPALRRAARSDGWMHGGRRPGRPPRAAREVGHGSGRRRAPRTATSRCT